MHVIFLFGDRNVFQLSDGSLGRAIRAIERGMFGHFTFRLETADPFGTYLSLVLWAALDRRLLAQDRPDRSIT